MEEAADIINRADAELVINFALGKLPLDAYDEIDDNADFRVKSILVATMAADEDFDASELDASMSKCAP